MNNLASSVTNKRRFTRVPCVSHITLIHNNEEYYGDAINISFNGILLFFEHQFINSNETLFDVYIHFEDGNRIQADIKLAYHHNHHYGFCFHRIDSLSLIYIFNIISRRLKNRTKCQQEVTCLFR